MEMENTQNVSSQGFLLQSQTFFQVQGGGRDRELKLTKFCHSKAAFWDIDFKLVIKKQKTPKETSTLPLFCLRDSEGKTHFRKEILGCLP